MRTQESRVTEANPAKLIFKDREDFRSFQAGQEKSFPVIAFFYGVIVIALVSIGAATRLSWPAAAVVDVVAFCFIGWSQYSLGNGMHEAVHHNLGNKKSDFLAALLTAYPIGLTVAYRDVHLRHHRHLGTQDDPELAVYTTFPRSKGALIRRFLWNVCGIPAALQFLQQRRDATFAGGKPDFAEPLKFALVQLIVVSAFWLVFGNILFYITFWVLPIMTIGKLLATTRLLCEHGSPDRDWVVRTIVASRWQTWLMGAFDFNFHGEHHLFPSIPYAQLHGLHQRHRAYIQHHPDYRPFGGRFEIFDGGYLALVFHWFRILPWAAARSAGR